MQKNFDAEKYLEAVDYDTKVEQVEIAVMQWKKEENDCMQVECDYMRVEDDYMRDDENDCIVAVEYD